MGNVCCGSDALLNDKNTIIKDQNNKELMNKIENLYNYYHKKGQDNFAWGVHHCNILDEFIPFIRENYLDNDSSEIKRFFDTKINENDLEFYTNDYVVLLRVNQCRSYSKSFQLMDYVYLFKKLRGYGALYRDWIHLKGGFYMRLVKRSKLAKKAPVGLSFPKMMQKYTLEFLGSLPKTKTIEGRQITKPFHGGIKPDIYDILVYGAVKGNFDLDSFKELKKLPKFEEWYNHVSDEIGHTSCKGYY
mmetsp:Transcript_39601/g.48987  ORF Transcript_39601/g.48987 Transcript_39601/m.48987 type:complete len:246 (+) Transcript_39601:18-755(+)